MVSDLIKNVMFFVLFASLDIHWDGMKNTALSQIFSGSLDPGPLPDVSPPPTPLKLFSDPTYMIKDRAEHRVRSRSASAHLPVALFSLISFL